MKDNWPWAIPILIAWLVGWWTGRMERKLEVRHYKEMYWYLASQLRMNQYKQGHVRVCDPEDVRTTEATETLTSPTADPPEGGEPHGAARG